MEYAGQNVALSSLSPTVSAAAALMLRRGDTWVRGGRRRSWCRMAAGSGAEAAALSAFLWLRSIRAGQKELEGSGNSGREGSWAGVEDGGASCPGRAGSRVGGRSASSRSRRWGPVECTGVGLVFVQQTCQRRARRRERASSGPERRRVVHSRSEWPRVGSRPDANYGSFAYPTSFGTVQSLRPSGCAFL